MDYLSGKFYEALGPKGLDVGVASEEFQKIVDRYSEVGRHYHNLEHVRRLLILCDEMGIEDTEITLAVFYHDIIYNPGSRHNEEKSVDFARRSLERIGISEDRTTTIFGMIMATRDHLSGEHDPATHLFLDLDMSILGAERQNYEQYVGGVRAEYSRVPDVVFRRNRRRFLEKLLKTEHIFRTRIFRNRFEERARENVAWEFEKL
jgi:predicted metal-dependent HD superfamily phosphohydrolase